MQSSNNFKEMLRSPERSPKRWRPSTAAGSKLNYSVIEQGVRNSYINALGHKFNIMRELNGENLEEQDKEMEIERLKTTCFNLNNKAAIADTLRKENEILNRRLEESENARSELETQNRSFKNEISSLKRDLKTALDEKTELQNALDEATNYNINMEEKVYKSNKISLDLLKEVKDMEVYIQKLQLQLGYYKPVAGDQIDILLAEFINNQFERPALKTLFVREAEGVYSFGTKKTNMKVEQGSLKVRVGGGYLSIAEFVDQYLPIEFDKFNGAPWRYTIGLSGIDTSYLLDQTNATSPKQRYSPEPRGPSPNTRKST